MPSNENSKQEESQQMSATEQRIHDAMTKLKTPPPPIKPIPKEEGEFNFEEWVEKMAQESVDNLNRNVRKDAKRRSDGV